MTNKETKKSNLIKIKKNLTRIIGGFVIILIIGLFIMNKTIKNDSEKAVSEYLKLAKSFEIGEMSVSNGNSITVDYIGRLEDGTIFDTSIEKVAKAGGVYQEGRDYSQGLTFQVGAGQMIPGFDKGVVGMKLGETKTINIPYMEAYGARDEKKILTMDMIDDFKKYKVGDAIMTPYGPVTVIDMNEEKITLDANHQLAGKDLIFDITIKEIK